MKKTSPILLGISLALTCGFLAAAQNAPSTPPKVIVIQREWIKPGKAGAVHDKSEAAFVEAMRRAKFPTHYVALNSMSGKSRALYVSPYASLEAWEKDNKTIEQNAALATDIDHAAEADGDLLEGYDQAVFVYDEDLSYHPHPDVSHARYYEITVFHMRPGHHKEWYGVVKMYKDTCEKSGSSAHWAAYEIVYGREAGTFIALTARNSLTEVDQGMAEFKKFMEAAGGDAGMTKLDDLFAQAVDSSSTQLFSVNPKQSYAEQAWIDADPDFWKPKSEAPETAAAKPAPVAPAAKASSR